MAKGDVVADVQAVTAAANLDFQPAAGVEVMISSVALGASASVGLWLYDGTDEGVYGTGAITNAAMSLMNSKILINNTTYIRLNNGSGATLDLGYTGIQTK